MIHRHSNFLEPDVLDALRKKFENSRGQAAFEINHMGRWGKGLEAGSYAPVLILPIPEFRDHLIEKYQALDAKFKEYPNLNCFMHIWLPGSQITFHHDASNDNPRLSSTIYLNETWNWNWGGLFLYDHPELGQGWIYPHSNSMIWFEPPIYHATSMVSSNAEHPRLSIQLFFNKY
jgi:Rps23 Pro-64 3,4-dihydroxylase Tpa1-like proline 4-hydroxylase